MNRVAAKSASAVRPLPRLHREMIHRRVRLGFVLLAIGYLALAGRLVYLQLVRHHYYQQQADRIRLRTFILPAQRGSILDRNGLPLAVNVEVGDIIADPTEIANPQSTATELAQLMPGSDAGALQQAIISAQSKKNAAGVPLRFVVLQKTVPYDQVQSIRAAMKSEQQAHFASAKNMVALAGISIQTRQIRSYPNGDLAAQVVGFVNKGRTGEIGSDGIEGKYGVEESMNAILSGRDGSITAETDAQGRIIPGTETNKVATVNGQDVRLTIDSNIQRIAQDELEKSWSKYHAVTGTVVVIDPNNGDILAIANDPTFNPNNIAGTTNLEWHDAAATDLYEPGSTMKALTLSACMDAEGLQHQYDHVYCDGTMQVGKYTIHCAKDPPLYGIHGDEIMKDVLKNSCNIGAATYGLRLGATRLYEYEKRFGLLERPDSGLPGEEYSHLISPAVKPWSQIELANISFGQGISLTPLQLASVYATIANNGIRVHPHILLNAGYNGPPQEVIKPQVAQAMLSMLQTVVMDGTGETAQVGGYNMGGKTGSAQIAEHGHYGDQYVGSFCGVVPLTHPRLIILCSIFKPSGIHWGAVVAAPVVHNIAKRALWYLRVPPDDPNMPGWTERNKDKAGEVSTFVPQEGAVVKTSAETGGMD